MLNKFHHLLQRQKPTSPGNTSNGEGLFGDDHLDPYALEWGECNLQANVSWNGGVK